MTTGAVEHASLAKSLSAGTVEYLPTLPCERKNLLEQDKPPLSPCGTTALFLAAQFYT